MLQFATAEFVHVTVPSEAIVLREQSTHRDDVLALYEVHPVAAALVQTLPDAEEQFKQDKVVVS